MNRTVDVLARLGRFARSMNPDLPSVEAALGAVRHLFEGSGIHFKFIGGVAVVHHGYARTTEDVDVLVEEDAPSRLQPLLASAGFERVSDVRLRHVATGVRVDLLVAGSPLPRVGGGIYPSPDSVPESEEDSAFVALSGLLELKLRSRRHRDVADVVELLKPVDEARYIELEAAVSRDLRPLLASLRRDALEELAQG